MANRHYPKWLYHKTDGARLFQSPTDVAAAGRGWSETPAKMVAPAAAKLPGTLRQAVKKAVKRRKVARKK
jgi:hypothetical protein